MDAAQPGREAASEIGWEPAAGPGTAPVSGHRPTGRAAQPSGHYPPIEPPLELIVARGTAHHEATVPRRRCAAPPASRTLIPLRSHPLGPGRAGRVGEIEDAAAGTLYVGQILAGQPHGQGREYLTGVAALNEAGCWLAYEGEWVRGHKTGRGTVHSLSGETYTGQLVDGMRQGQGRMQYCNGDVYEGGWEAGARAGQGRLTAAATGDVFVGRWVHDSREGPGSLYMLRAGKKYLAEYVQNAAQAGMWEDIAADELATLTGHDAAGMLASLSASRRYYPALELDAPYDLLAARLQQLRRGWGAGPKAGGAGAGAAGVSGGCGEPLSADELAAVRAAAAYEAAGGGESGGTAQLDTEQLRRLRGRLEALLGDRSAGAVGVLDAALVGGGSVTLDGLLAAACGAGTAARLLPEATATATVQ